MDGFAGTIVEKARNSQGMAGQWWWPVISLEYTRDGTKRSAIPLQRR